MSKENYNNVEITADELSALESTGTTESQVQEPQVEEPSSEVNESVGEEQSDVQEFDPEDYVIEIDGKDYDLSDIMEWQKDSQNKSDWNKSNTEKAQEIARLGKLANKLKEDDSFRDHLKDYFDDDKDYKSLNIESWVNSDYANDVDQNLGQEASQEIPSELEQRLERLEDVDQERFIEQETQGLANHLESLEQKYPDLINEGNVHEFLDFMIDNEIGDMEAGFRVWSYDAMSEKMESLSKLDENRQRNTGKVISESEVGAKEVKSPKIKTTDWKEITLDDPDIAKYFNE
tara:strand:- start:2633 stop:3502 length:870 start_codon:yes stop_codon:yes gene_type:complete